MSASGTNLIVPAIPIAISHDGLFLGLSGRAVNSGFHHPKCFSMLPRWPRPETRVFSAIFAVPMASNPLALLAEDAEFPKTPRR